MIKTTVVFTALALLSSVVPALAQQAQAPAPASTLPGGASSLQETYQDWQVACEQQDTGKRCAMLQQQSQQSGQRILAIQLVADAGGKAATGTLVLPFGLALEAGVTLQIDDAAAQQPLRFNTCLPAGCVVPLTFAEGTLTALRGGTALKVNATASGTNQPVALSVSLKGFSAALDRTIALAH
ncbi:MAG TPA: invasion associated locus B family protein [Devosiaceae bacterium]|jgi:invasion protein IalB